MNKAKAKTRASSNKLPSGGSVDVSPVAPLISGDSLHDAPQVLQRLSTQSPSQNTPLPGTVCPARLVAQKQRHIQTVARNSLTFLISDSFNSEIFGQRLTHLAETVLSLRRFDELGRISKSLSQIERFKPVAAYYQGLATERLGKGNLTLAQSLYEYAADSAPLEYKARALTSLGAIDFFRGNPNPARFSEALACENSSIITRLNAARGLAFTHAVVGEHFRAIEFLEALYPVAKRISAINPRLYCDILNSLAIEYSEVGRHEDAEAIFAPVRRSCLFNAITEYQETAREIQASIAELEQRALIIAVPQIQVQEKRKGKGERKPVRNLDWFLFCLASKRKSSIIVLAIVAKTSIQSRLRYSIHPHAPPFRAEK